MDPCLYHVTRFRNLEGISESGLVPCDTPNFGQGYRSHCTGRVFLSERRNVYSWYHTIASLVDSVFEMPWLPAAKNDDDRYVWWTAAREWSSVILRVDIEDLPCDPVPDSAGMLGDYFITGVIAPELLELCNPLDCSWGSLQDTVDEVGGAIDTLIAQDLARDPSGESYELAPGACAKMLLREDLDG